MSAEADGADPAWLRLPVIHYALMQGNQQPSFRLATGQHDTRHWLAWEVGFVSCHRPAWPFHAMLRWELLGGCFCRHPAHAQPCEGPDLY